MTVLRDITTLGLCLFLAVTSVTLAVARGAPGPAGMIVICSGDGTQRVAVDSEGQPVAPPHVCPDCLLALHASAARDPLPSLHDACTSAHHPFAEAGHAAGPTRPAMLARAPPFLV